jgi:hypothetical protein
MPAFIDTGLNVVDARDVAIGQLLACEHGRAGERYILGSENLTLAQILAKLAAITGRPAPTVQLPYAVAYAAGVVTTAWARVTGKPPRAPLDAVRMARKKMFVSHAKAARELGFRTRSRGRRAAPGGGMVSGQRILLVAAEPREFDGLLRFCSGVRKLAWPVYWARSGECGGRRLWMVANGAGAAHAGRAAEAACAACRPEAIVSMGFCGALDPALEIGDVFVATAVDAAGRRFDVRLPQSEPGTRPACWPPSIMWRRLPPKRPSCGPPGLPPWKWKPAGRPIRRRARYPPVLCTIRHGYGRPELC